MRHSPAGRKALVGIVVVVVGGFFFARALYQALLQPTPDFPSLATTPDPSLTGTVAFVKPGDDRCVYVIAASGGEPEELACGDGLAGELTWRDDGHLQSIVHPNADSDDDPLVWIIDPATGAFEKVPRPPFREPPDNARPGPNDLDHLLLVTTADPSVTRFLVDDGYWAAVTEVEPVEG